MKFKLLTTVLLLINTCLVYCQELRTFSSIPGRIPSTKYSCRVREICGNEWQEAFVIQTTSLVSQEDTNGNNLNGYVGHLNDWSASWLAFEFGQTGVEVEISKVGGTDITKAMVRPVGDASSAEIINGKAYIKFSKPGNVNVDIDGQMEDQYTGMGYSGPPIHTISIFANPLFKIPDLTNPRVLHIQPSESIPTDVSLWDTIYFAPGIHHIGTPYLISSNKVLYIPGDAIVHGTIHPIVQWTTTAWSVYGSGALSGEEIPHLHAVDVNVTGDSFNKPFTKESSKIHLEGFVVVDPAHHSFTVFTATPDTNYMNVYKNLKILGWRLNSDGFNGFRNSKISDCFFRCQDDAMAYGGDNVKIDNMTLWNDFNGSALWTTRGANDTITSYCKNLKVIYHRAGWHYWGGGRVISFRDNHAGSTMKNVLIKNVLIEDPFPAFAPFYFTMENPSNTTTPSVYENIVIENVNQKYPFVPNAWGDNAFGPPKNRMTGSDSAGMFKNITFKNCFYNGHWLSSFSDGDFITNSFIDSIEFNLSDTLPFQFNLFALNSSTNLVNLNWEVLNDYNTDYFIVERSSDGVNFVNISQINSLSPSSSNLYSYSDSTLLTVPGFYRIKRIHLNGNQTISTTEYNCESFLDDTGIGENNFENHTLYPNPSSSYLTVELKDGFKIYNSVGQVILESDLPTNEINISHFVNGVYILKTSSNYYPFVKN